MTNPNRLYETERKRQQRARIAAGQVHKVVVYLTEDEFKAATRNGMSADEGIRGSLRTRYLHLT